MLASAEHLPEPPLDGSGLTQLASAELCPDLGALSRGWGANAVTALAHAEEEEIIDDSLNGPVESPAAAPPPAATDDGYLLDTRPSWGSAAAGLELPLSQRLLPLVKIPVAFQSEDAEREYRRFLYRDGLAAAGVMMTLAAIAFPVYITTLEVVAPVTNLAVTLTGVFLAMTALFAWAACLHLVLLLRGLDSVRDRDAIADIELRHALRHKVVVAIGMPIFALGAAVTTMLAGVNCVVPPMAPPDPVDHCVDSFREAFAIPLAGVFLFIRDPRIAITAGIVLSMAIPIFEGAIVPRHYSARAIGARTLLSLLFSAALGAMSTYRDFVTRRHFSDIVEAHVMLVKSARRTTEVAAVVAAMLPVPVAVRAAKVNLGALFTDKTAKDNAADFGTALAVMSDQAFAGTVCVTGAADFAGFEQEHLLHSAVIGLSHIFTLFDAGARVFAVDNGGFFGDAYIVTANLVQGSKSSVLNCVRFALWQHSLEEATVLHLRTAIVTGSLSGGVVGANMLRYQVQGAALKAAFDRLQGTPAGAIHACTSTIRSCGRTVEAQRISAATWHITTLLDSLDDETSMRSGQGMSGTLGPNSLVTDSLARQALRDLQPARSADAPADKRALSNRGGSATGESPAGNTTSPATDSMRDERAVTVTIAPNVDVPPDPVSFGSPSATDLGVSNRDMADPPSSGTQATATSAAASRSRKRQSMSASTVGQVSPMAALMFDATEEHLETRVEHGHFVDPTLEERFVAGIDEDLERRGWLPAFAVTGICVLVMLLHIVFLIGVDDDRALHPALAGVGAAAAGSIVLGLLCLKGLASAIGVTVGLCICVIGMWISVAFLPASGVRNDMIYLVVIVVPTVVPFALVRFQRLWLVGLAVGGVTTIPAFMSTRIDASAIAIALLIAGLMVSVVYLLAITSRRQFASRYDATFRASAVKETTERLAHTTKRLMPEQVARRGVDGAMFFELQVLAAPVDGDAVEAGRKIEAKLARLADVCREDHGARVPVADGLLWFVTVHVQFTPCMRDHRGRAVDPSETPDVLTLDLWNEIDVTLLDACTALGDPTLLRTLKCVNNTLVLGGPFRSAQQAPSDDTITLAAAAAADFLRRVSRRLKDRYAVSAGLATEECQGSLMGRGAMRYSVQGPSVKHAAACAELAEVMSQAPGRKASQMVVVATRHYANALRGDARPKAAKRVAFTQVSAPAMTKTMGHLRPYVLTFSGE